MDYTSTSFPFRIEYPVSENLGRSGIIAYMLDAFFSVQRSGIYALERKIENFKKFLMDRQESDGLWAFDDFKYSIDADTTLMIALTLLNSGVNTKFFKSTQNSILNDFRSVNACRSFRHSDSFHSNFDVHVEVTSNAIYFLKSLGIKSDEEIGDIEEWLMKTQNENGFWESYWYPSLYLGTFRAIRALGCSKRFDRNTLNFLKISQNEDGGWGYPNSIPLDSAFALQTLQLYPNKCPEVEKGLEYLIQTQNPDGSWDGTTIFYFYYPDLSGKTGCEEWHTRNKKLISTSLAAKCLSNYIIHL